MVNKKNWVGILVLILVFGMTVVGCDDELNEESDLFTFEGTSWGTPPGLHDNYTHIIKFISKSSFQLIQIEYEYDFEYEYYRTVEIISDGKWSIIEFHDEYIYLDLKLNNGDVWTNNYHVKGSSTLTINGYISFTRIE